jgi:hypothetical protein
MSQCTIINAHVTDQVIQLTNLPRIASGSKDALQFRCSFCGKWEGCGKVAVFYRTESQVYHVPVVDNLVTVPWEVLQDEGHFWFGFMGQDDLTRTTEVIRVEVAKGALTVATATSDPTPDIYHLMLARFNEAVAMRSVGGATTYELDDARCGGSITSNGASAYIDLTIRGMAIEMADRDYYETGYIIPPAYAPLVKTYLQPWAGFPKNLNVAIDPEHANEEGWLKFEIRLVAGMEPPGLDQAEGYYPLASVSVAELADVRVGYDGTTYDTAGDAVRGQISGAVAFVVPALEGLENRVEYLEEHGGGGGGGGAGLPDASEAFADNCALVTQNGEWVIAPVPFATKEDTYTLTVRCEFLTERVTTLESSAGDIDAALDGIIAIQESLITGGTDLTMAEEEGF